MPPSFFLFLSFFFCVFSLPLSASQAQSLSWETDWTLAQQKAEQENKDMLLVFTGSDWCLPCQMLKKNVLLSSHFQKLVSDKFICLEIDFPKKTPTPPQTQAEKATQKINSELSTRYKVRGLPSLVFAFPDGRPYAFYLEEIRAFRKAHPNTKSTSPNTPYGFGAPEEFQVILSCALERKAQLQSFLQNNPPSSSPETQEKLRPLLPKNTEAFWPLFFPPSTNKTPPQARPSTENPAPAH